MRLAYPPLTRTIVRLSHPPSATTTRIRTRRIAPDVIHTQNLYFSTSRKVMSGTVGAIAEAYNAAVSQPATVSKLPEDANTKAHHAPGGGFQNPWDSWKQAQMLSLMKGVFSHRYQNGMAGPSTHEAPTVVKPTFPATRSTKSTEFRATWLGHACYYVEFPGGLRVLFDPVFSQRCSPVQFMGPKRYTKMPCDIADIPVVDIVCISHNHYDHLDYNTILKLKKSHPRAWFFVPLGNKEWFTATGIENCTEMDWWEDREVSLTPATTAGSTQDGDSISADAALAEEGASPGSITARIGCVPCQHTSNRGLTDRSATLWSGWSIESGGKKLYFAGDTGYRAVPKESEGLDDYGEEFKDLPVCPAFKQIGKLRGPFDLGLLPIGAYVPRWVMSPMHANPKDAVNIFVETECKKALGMHWGTFVLTDENVMEPPQKLKEAMVEKGLDATGVFDVIDIGASKVY
ncbi:beta-lactamase superfamily domain-containing protein [Geopyxis carbonaria]|nr:beta-lactamase superfamily domain-containing protein [Geopyxis carbonaria]